MSDSSDELVNVEIPYSKRPEWADVTPITEDGETNDICRIAYTETFKEVYGYFRSILKLDEKSTRALELTKDAALLNPANYTVWYFRRLVLEHLKSDLAEELEFITNVIRSNPKNYQVWQHRRSIVEKLNEPSDELTFTANILKRDSKNYHAWQYRQWVIRHFDLWSNELDYVQHLVDKDVRNNSAWNQRYFMLSHELDVAAATSKRDILSRELDYTLGKITVCVDNESSWNYLRALTTRWLELVNADDDDDEATYPPNVVEFCISRYRGGEDKEADDTSPFFMAFIVDYNYWLCKKALKNSDQELSDDKKAEVSRLVKTSIEILESLANRFDTIRVNYWNYLDAKWKQEFKQFI